MSRSPLNLASVDELKNALIAKERDLKNLESQLKDARRQQPTVLKQRFIGSAIVLNVLALLFISRPSPTGTVLSNTEPVRTETMQQSRMPDDLHMVATQRSEPADNHPNVSHQSSDQLLPTTVALNQPLPAAVALSQPLPTKAAPNQPHPATVAPMSVSGNASSPLQSASDARIQNDSLTAACGIGDHTDPAKESHFPISPKGPVTKKTLVVLLGNARGGEETWSRMYEYVLQHLQADLALMFEGGSSFNNSLVRKAKYVWVMPRPKQWTRIVEEAARCPAGWPEKVTARPFGVDKGSDKRPPRGRFGRGFAAFRSLVLQISWT